MVADFLLLIKLIKNSMKRVLKFDIFLITIISNEIVITTLVHISLKKLYI